MRRGRQKGKGQHQRQEQPRIARVHEPASSARIYMNHGIDINTNLGEGFGHYKVDNEAEILPYVTSANIACGAHAGDPVHMEEALEMVRYYGLALGAHIGYPDLQGFGRRELHLSSSELRANVLFQLGALSGMARTFGFEITQVRPHGYLYRQMSHDVRVATIVAKAIAEFDPWLVVIGPASNPLLQSGERAGIRVAPEAWVDRVYDADGNLLPHTHSRAILKNPNEILKQAANLIYKNQVVAVDGTIVHLDFQTIHLHANVPESHYIAEEIRRMVPNACALTSEPFSVEQEDGDPELAFS
ncbi:LamB/YcsF family protein [Candidatus Obscuribacterales bacterium]|nr:LamB/YcsF family protein [Candidatus Obscuribacterales bacterium]MBX3136814.1 LamB/YcsF family protein [Candidatus Obscuribacterales bacterium]MBX3150529.1 LamB/YcsF family protein [Candidatus Obscuribacterales bacterium]